MTEALTASPNQAGADMAFSEAEIAELNLRIRRLEQQRQKYAT
jgi:hypothetical protein